jgi:hypothetical protein
LPEDHCCKLLVGTNTIDSLFQMGQKPPHRDPFTVLAFRDKTREDEECEGASLLILRTPLEDALGEPLHNATEGPTPGPMDVVKRTLKNVLELFRGQGIGLLQYIRRGRFRRDDRRRGLHRLMVRLVQPQSRLVLAESTARSALHNIREKRRELKGSRLLKLVLLLIEVLEVARGTGIRGFIPTIPGGTAKTRASRVQSMNVAKRGGVAAFN